MENRKDILTELKEISPILAGDLQVPYNLPAGYFETLPQVILARMAQSVPVFHSELEEIAPLLNGVSRQNVYSVPSGYFDRAIGIPEESKHAKVISLTPLKRWMQYATAAVVAGILVTGAFFISSNDESEYKKYSRLDVPAELNKVSETELATYLASPDRTIVAGAGPGDIAANIRDVSDEELARYLKENADAETSVTAVSN